MRKWFVRVLWALLFIAIVGTAGCFWAIATGKIGYMPPIEDLQNPINRFASQVYSADGELLGTWSYSRENRVMVDYSELSPYLVEALVATEDARFYDHSGIDFWALGRAIIKRGILQQRSAGGGSTITQQLAKQLYTEVAHSTGERLLQKPIEWVIAVQLERTYTKDEIIALYLNYFDFLYNAVGIKTAANTYFSKEPSELTITESATLIGMCKNPSYYNPKLYPERSLERRNVVLHQMLKEGYLSEEEYDSCREEPLNLLNFHIADHNSGQATYFRDFLRRYMMATEPEPSDYGDDSISYRLDRYNWDEDPLYGWCNKNHKRDGSTYNIYTDGLKIYTTIDTRMQKYAEEACYEHVVEYLQPAFDQSNRNRRHAPYAANITNEDFNRIMRRNIRKTERYRVMKNAGATQEEIDQAFNTPVPMTVFTFRGERDTVMTPTDSILYYKSFLRTGFLSMDARNGHVKAYVGGLNFRYFAYDMATKGRRQVGSTIKPFLYSLAMEDGYTPCDTICNIQRSYPIGYGRTWTPRNGSRARYGENVTLQWGLQQSNNWISAELIDRLTPSNFKRHLYNFGIRNPEIQATPALCLGPCEITVAEMVSAYSVFACHGTQAVPMFVTKITDSEGNVLAEESSLTNRRMYKQVIGVSSADKMIYMLRSVVDGGTGSRLRYRYGIQAPLGGKTGTTNQNSDAWFMGIAPKLITGCWVGGDDRDIHFETMAYGQGAAAALPIFALYIKKVYADPNLEYSESDQFDMPAGFSPCQTDDDFDYDEDEDFDEDYEDDDDYGGGGGFRIEPIDEGYDPIE